MIQKVSLFDSSEHLTARQKYLIQVLRDREYKLKRIEKFWSVYSQLRDEVSELDKKVNELRLEMSDDERMQVLKYAYPEKGDVNND